MSTHVWDRLSAYIDRELAQTERAAVDAHLRECADCARAVEEMRAVDALARGQEVEAPSGYFEGLPGRLRTRLSPRAPLRVAPWAVALAAGLAVAVVAPLVLRDSPMPHPAVRQASVPPPAAPTPAGGTPAFQAPVAEAPPAARLLASPAPTEAARALKKESGRIAGELQAQAPPAMPAPHEGLAAGMEVTPRRDEREATARQDEARNRVFAVPPAAPEEDGRVGGLRRRGVGARAPVPPRSAPVPAASAVAPEGEAAGEADVDEEAALVSDNSGPARDAAARPHAATGQAGAAPPSPTADPRFEALAGRAARSAAEARALRDAWQAYVRENPQGPRADAARVAALEAGAAAWRLGGRPEDRAQVERDGREYLRRPQAADKERVRALLAGLQP